MCAASLKNAGPCLVSHCLCSWIVSVGYSPDFVISVVDSDDKLESKLARFVCTVVLFSFRVR